MRRMLGRALVARRIGKQPGTHHPTKSGHALSFALTEFRHTCPAFRTLCSILTASSQIFQLPTPSAVFLRSRLPDPHQSAHTTYAMFISGPYRPTPATRRWTCVNNTHQLIGTVIVASDSSTRCIPDVGMSEPFPSDRNDVVRQRFVGNACSKLQSTCVWQNAHPSVSPVSTLNNVAQKVAEAQHALPMAVNLMYMEPSNIAWTWVGRQKLLACQSVSIPSKFTKRQASEAGRTAGATVTATETVEGP